MDRPPWYDTALVCRNGHVINFSFHAHPLHNTRFCEKCGAESMMACPHCNAEIRGYYNSGTLFLSTTGDVAPSFCHACGEPYPWTAAALEAAREYALEIEGLDDRERRQLAESLDDLVRETPRTALAAGRFKRLVAKAGGTAAPMMRELIVNIASETARKAMGL